MKYVYICSPYRPVGEDPETELRKNIDQAKRACRLAVSRGLIPLAPHLYFTQFLDDNDPQERRIGQQAGKEWMRSQEKGEAAGTVPQKIGICQMPA